MPRKDGTGPMGAGAMTGRGMGLCSGSHAQQHGAGRGMGFGPGRACRRGFGGGFGRGFALVGSSAKPQKELLQEQQTMLRNRLEAVEQQLKDL